MALSWLYIRDYAIVRRLELPFESGLTVLTGETGAGKSIMIDALALCLGERADTGNIRHGAEGSEILASFDLGEQDDAADWLRQQDLFDEHECMLRRLIYREKPTKAFINGRPVPVQLLRELGDLLVDIHGQHEHQSLLKRDMQRQILDDYAGASEQSRELAANYQILRSLKERFDRLAQETSDRQSRIDLLSFQVNELEEMNLESNEYASLDQEHSRLAHANELIEGLQSLSQALYDAEEGSVTQELGSALQRLEGLSEYDARLGEIAMLLNEATIRVDEAASQIHQQLDRVESDPGRLQWVEDRLGLLLDLARKHQTKPHHLPGVLEALRVELTDIEDADTNLEKLKQEIDSETERYKRLAKALSEKRFEAGGKLSQSVSEEMQGLGMTGGEFEVTIETNADADPTAYGYDRIEYRVSANPGQPLRPLTKVASGGELSRISLAIQVVTAAIGRVPSMIFDEVDVGIGGAVAEIVGQKLRTLGGTRQVLCITHLPQVAAQGHHHRRVAKDESDGVHVNIEILDRRQRVQEVARMLGGLEITDQSLAHAEEMLQRAAV